MTFQILKSWIAGIPDFEVKVAAHALEMKNWRVHMARVREDDGKPNLAPIERHIACPRPGAHRLVEAAVNENDTADYQIVDDGPTPEQIFLEKRKRLFDLVSKAESDAINEVMPVGKRRALDIREQDIRAEDVKRERAIAKPSLLSVVASAVGLAKPVNIDAEVAKARPDLDTKHLEDQSDRRRKINTIQRAAAQAHSDIEDLTIDTIDAWSIPKFPD